MPLKTYELTCPGCNDDMEIELDSSVLADDGDCIQCPSCDEEWEWEYDEATDTLTLTADAPDEDDEDDEDETDDGGDND